MKLSVIMPVYNAENYLDDTIKSITQQTFSDFEFLIANDGSTDRSIEIIRDYEKKDPRIKVIDRENRGLIRTLNELVSIAQGEYIARMDADDIAFPKRFEKQIDFLTKNSHVGVCGTSCIVFGENIADKKWIFPDNTDEIKARMLFSVPVAHPTIIAKSEVMKNKSYDERFDTLEDYKLWSDLIDETIFSNLTEPLLRYRYNDQGISRQADAKRENERYVKAKEIFQSLLCKINLKATDEDLWIHFIIASNERTLKYIKILNKEVIKYFDLLLLKNKKTRYFNQNYLYRMLAMKITLIGYYKLKNMDGSFFRMFFNKYFLLGFYFHIKKKFFSRVM